MTATLMKVYSVEGTFRDAITIFQQDNFLRLEYCEACILCAYSRYSLRETAWVTDDYPLLTLESVLYMCSDSLALRRVGAGVPI